MELEVVKLEHLPDNYHIHIALFRDVKNAAFLHEQLLARNTDFEYAFVDASVIADAYRRFGISPTTKDLVVAKITFPTEAQPQPATTESIAKHLLENVQGSHLSVTDENIAACTDMTKVRKYYKLNGINWLDALQNTQAQKQQIEGLVIGSMALRGV
ncbi:hypothetical protein V2A60_002877 [Cordyceps javanica]|uniref:EKC/KEOPS complex subunit CGI121 n=1 Tax=Cordyceps javanica TaxID=43265 RepID=A0A545VW26_9HYPO|nr:kinase binding protein [Cordyceps javanica]TQW05929.1 kinase binding protein [Cordyceps javanica]